MATGVHLLVQSFYSGFSSNQLKLVLQFPISSVAFGSSSGVAQISAFTSARDSHNFKLKHLLQASAEGVPSELIEDSKFVPFNAEEPSYGPPALLLCGFELEETAKIQEFLRVLDGEFLKVIHCTEDMISGSLGEAMNTQQNTLDAVKIAKSLPRICFLSGLSGEEMLMFIDAFPEAGLEPAVFAALVPNSANKPLQEVIEEIMGDHEMMKAKEMDST